MNEEIKNVQAPEATKSNTLCGRLDGYFGITKRGSSFRTEIIAGIVTFLAMCYILTVNPNQFFYAGTLDPRWTAVFMSTAFGAIIGTVLMAFLAKLPLAQAPGMGLNALVGSIIGGGVGAFAYSFSFSLGNAMLMVLISGIVFLLLSVIAIKGKSLRQLIFEGVPEGIRRAIPVGIGLFIAFIGFQNSKIIADSPYTLVDLVSFNALFGNDAGVKLNVCNALVCFFGLIVIAVLSHVKVKGAVIFGILAATLLGIPLGVTNLGVITGEVSGITWKFWENFANYFAGENSVFAICFTDGFNFPEGSVFTIIMLVITMSMIDMFDTMGTCVGCCSAAGLMNEKGMPINYNKIMYSDSIATCAGAIMGTSTVTTFVESGAGIAAGGKTGLTALVTAVMFLLSIFLLPLFAMIPSAAASSALVYVGVLMLKGVRDIDFSDVRIAVPAFLAIAIMPLGYSITKGIGISILSYVIISLFAYLLEWVKYAVSKDEAKEKPVLNVTIVTLVIAILFVVYFFIPAVL